MEQKKSTKDNKKRTKPNSDLLTLINQKITEYVSCTDAEALDALHSDIVFMVSHYFVLTASEKRITSMFGSVYAEVLEKTLDAVSKNGIAHYDLTDKSWFIREFRTYLSRANGTIKRKRDLEGDKVAAQMKHIDRKVVALYDKYGFPIKERPGAKNDRTDGLNAETQEAALRKLFATKSDIAPEVVEKEISELVSFINSVHAGFDASAFDNGSEDDFQVSMSDKYAIDKDARDVLDARRFIACALKFYGAITEAKYRKYAKHFITFKLVVARPSAKFMDVITNYEEEDILEKKWLDYLNNCETDEDKGREFYKLLPDFVQNHEKAGKLSEKTARDDYNRTYEDLLVRLKKEKEFSHLVY